MLRMREYRKQHKIRRENDENLQKQYRKKEKLKKRKQRLAKKDSHAIANKKRGISIRKQNNYHKDQEIEKLRMKVKILDAKKRRLQRQIKNIALEPHSELSYDNSDNSNENVDKIFLVAFHLLGKKGRCNVLN